MFFKNRDRKIYKNKNLVSYETIKIIHEYFVFFRYLFHAYDIL